jgi:hypothetical protein
MITHRLLFEPIVSCIQCSPFWHLEPLHRAQSRLCDPILFLTVRLVTSGSAYLHMHQADGSLLASDYSFQAVYLVLCIWYFVFLTHESSVLATLTSVMVTLYLRLPEVESKFWTVWVLFYSNYSCSSKAMKGSII